MTESLLEFRPKGCTCGQTHTTWQNGKGVSNSGHSVGCEANPMLWKQEDWPAYLDDEGYGNQFVRHDLAANEEEVLALLRAEGLYDEGAVDFAEVWMRPKPAVWDYDPAYLEVTDEEHGVARYWQVKS